MSDSLKKETLSELCIRLEHFETPQWAAEAILEREIMTSMVIDPCAGTGILSDAAHRKGYKLSTMDIFPWGPGIDMIGDFLKTSSTLIELNVSFFMNPPFSLAERFVEHAFHLGARKVVCFQRFAWFESADRREFWDKNPPTRVYVCGNRADCWRHDLPKNDKGHRFDPKTGKKLTGTTTAHAWFVFERGHRGGTVLDRLYKPEKGAA